MFVGPVFTREAASAPRSWRLYFLRALYVAALFALVATAWLILFGSQPVRTLADLARFGSAAFSLVAPVQLAVAVAFSALLCAAAVAQEKDRRTYELLLLTRMTNSELVLGKLLASMLTVLVLSVAAVPLLMLLVLLGGVSHAQVMRVCCVTLAAALVAGTIGSTIALWREKSFQSLAMTALALVAWLLLGEAAARGLFGDGLLGLTPAQLGEAASPLRAIAAAARPTMAAYVPVLGDSVQLFMLAAVAAVVLLNVLAVACVRIWNPTRELRGAADDARDVGETLPTGDAGARASVHAAPGRVRRVWDNPILWREVRTWAYGKKVVIVRLAYIAVFGACTAAAVQAMRSGEEDIPAAGLPRAAQATAPLVVVGLLLVNALAVTSVTNERDAGALDLLLVTDLTPKEIIFGKMGGVLYNAKEMWLLPAALGVAGWRWGWISGENLFLVLITLAVLTAFVAMLGIHSGMTYANSRTAVGVSLGTLMFLVLGIAVCMRMMIAFQYSFDYQLQAFLAFMVGGGIGLFWALGSRNPSRAIATASMLAPFATFYVLSNFLRSSYGAAAMIAVAMYGFTTLALLMPAIFEFDVATGRTAAKDI